MNDYLGISRSAIAATRLMTKILSLTIRVRSSGSVDRDMRSHLVDRYGRRWLAMSAIFPSLPHFVRAVEVCILAGTQESMSKFRRDQERLLANTGTTAAIISQVTVTSIQLNNVDAVHWSVRGCFFSSLVFSLVSVFLSFLKHRDICSMNNYGLESRFTVACDNKQKRLNMSVVIALYLPYSILNAAILIYSYALTLYLIASWFPSLSITGAHTPENRNVLIIYVLSLFIGYSTLIFVQRSRIYQKSPSGNDDLDDVIRLATEYPCPPQEIDLILNKFHQGDIKGFRRDRENMIKTYSFKSESSDSTSPTSPRRLPMSPKQADPMSRKMNGYAPPPPAPAPTPSGDFSELYKALADAAVAHRAAAAASEAVAAQYERLSADASPFTRNGSFGPPPVFPVRRASTWPHRSQSWSTTAETAV